MENKVRLTIEIEKTNGVYNAYINDDCGGSGIDVSADTAEELADEMKPYLEGYAEDCVMAEYSEDGRLKVRLSDHSFVWLKTCFDIVGISNERHTVIVTEEDGEKITEIEGLSRLPDPEDVDEEFIDLIEQFV